MPPPAEYAKRPGVQREGLPYKEGGRCRAEADSYPLVDTDHADDDEQDEESQETPAEMCIRDSVKIGSSLPSVVSTFTFSCALAVMMPIARANMMITFLITFGF